MLQAVYQIRNKINGKVYVGSTYYMKHRCYSHLYLLRKGAHHSAHLQGAFNLYGEESFVIETLEVVQDAENLLGREQYWIDRLGTCDDQRGYNIALQAGAPMAGRKHTEETLKKVSEASINWHRDNKGSPGYEVYTRRLSAALQGHACSDETRGKISAAAKKRTGDKNPFFGRRHSAETKRALSERLLGIVQAPETNRKRSETLKKNRTNQGANNKGSKLTEGQVLEIRKRAATGERTVELAAEYGMSKASIVNIKAGITWKHLPQAL